MSLPGKLCIGILEEDNPQKSYFRFKPLLVESGGKYVPFTEGKTYPEDGCIRIVPDKNEAYHFKARMRRIGLFCVVDLRAHPDDKDKIRPNKNFHEGSSEHNAFIIYSDVVREPAPRMIHEILSRSAPDALRPQPHTSTVLMRGDAVDPEIYNWESARDAEGWARLLPTGESCPMDRAQVFDLESFRGEIVSFAILPPGDMERISDAPIAPHSTAMPMRSRWPEYPQEAAPAQEPIRVPVSAATTAQEPNRVSISAATPATEPARTPATAESAQEPASPVAPAQPATAAEQPAESAPAAEPAPAEATPVEAPPVEAPPAEEPVPADDEPKPWIHRDESMRPRPIDPRLSPAQRSLAIQSGMNPRRGRSLQELIDEKWQASRLNQLGLSPAPIQTGTPVASPVDSAVRAVREVWNQPQLRKGLLESLGGIEEFGASLEECRAAARKMDIDAHLDDLEARRLALLGELDHLNLRNDQVRQSLKQELLRQADAELAEARGRAEDARAEQARCEKLANEARAAAKDARKAVKEMTAEALEQQLTQFALSEHMIERMREIKGEAEALPPAAPALQEIDLNAMAVRVMNRFDASGFAITRAEALNLCACAAISPVLILSGPVGSGKTETARMLAESLGVTAVDRFLTFAPGHKPLADDGRVKALSEMPNVPAMLLLDDANLYPSFDPLRGLDAVLAPQWRLCLTVQDGGFPLPARALDRGFTLRLNPKPAAPWRPRPRAACAPEAPASLALALPEGALPAAAETRMDALRAKLDRLGATLSRRALDDAWNYCALMLDALGDAGDPVDVLDRAVAQRIVPALLASAPAAALHGLPELLEGLPISLALLKQALPIEV